MGLISFIIIKAKVKTKTKAKIKAKTKTITKAKAKAKGLKGLKRGKKENQIRIRAEGHLTALIIRNQNTEPLIHQKIRPIASLWGATR